MALIVTLGIAVALVVWARWLGHQGRAPRAVRHLAWSAVVVAVAGPLGTAYGLVRAFRTIEHVDAAHRSRALAEGIALAMLPTVASIALLLAHAFVLLLVTWRFHWIAPPAPRGDAPPR